MAERRASIACLRMSEKEGLSLRESGMAGEVYQIPFTSENLTRRYSSGVRWASNQRHGDTGCIALWYWLHSVLAC